MTSSPVAPPQIIITDRLSIKPLAPADAQALQKLTDNPAITGAISFLTAPFTVADAEALIGCNSGERDCFFGIWKGNGETLIGLVGAHLRADTEIEVGYWLGTAWHGQRYATEALHGLATVLKARFPERSIIAECRPENLASWRVLEKAGFQPTGDSGLRAGRQVLVLRGSSERG
jgi:RimJ/RimL family protein N-acetyltransferase